MPSLLSFVPCIAALAPLTQALGWANVQNNCPYPIYVWSISNPPFKVGTMNNITTGNCYTEQYQSVKMGGVSLGISTNGEKGESVLFDKSPQTDFAYTLDGSKVWYDVTDMYGDAFKGCPITVQADNPTCGKTTWSDGIVTKPNEILECTSDCDITLTLC